MKSTTFLVNGMTCNNCVAHLTEEFMANEAVTEVAVHLVAGGASTVTVTGDRELTPEEVAEAVEEAGYSVTL